MAGRTPETTQSVAKVGRYCEGLSKENGVAEEQKKAACRNDLANFESKIRQTNLFGNVNCEDTFVQNIVTDDLVRYGKVCAVGPRPRTTAQLPSPTVEAVAKALGMKRRPASGSECGETLTVEQCAVRDIATTLLRVPDTSAAMCVFHTETVVEEGETTTSPWIRCMWALEDKSLQKNPGSSKK